MLTRLVLQKIHKWFDDEVDPEVRERTAADGHGELLPVKVTFTNNISLSVIFCALAVLVRCNVVDSSQQCSEPYVVVWLVQLMQDPDLIKRVKLLFALCWRTPQTLLKSFVLVSICTVCTDYCAVVPYCIACVYHVCRTKH